MKARPGTVYLVGAGPGDPGLITTRGLALVRSCDVLLYDRLVAPQLVDEAPAEAELIFVGKRAGQVHSRQVISDALLLQKAVEGKAVVRLKGGDPFVFGRGGEEARLLAEAGIPFELVPGVSSATAVPAYAGIPVTQRGTAASFAVLTGREEEGGPHHDWEALARGVDTLVLLMGVGALRVAATGLIEGGRPADQPAAVIEWGTTAAQRVVVGPLKRIADIAEEAGIRPPATTVVGDVVALRDAIAWAERRPLFGHRVVVTRAASAQGSLQEGLSALGAEVIDLPVIQLGEPPSFKDLDASLLALADGDYEWVVFASANAVERIWARLLHLHLDARAVRARVAAVGRATSSALSARGISADLVPRLYTAEELAAELGEGGGRVLMPRVADAPRRPVEALTERGWDVHEVVAYSNLPTSPQGPAFDRVRAGDYDVVTFTSGSTVRNFVGLVGVPEWAAVACIGPSTAEEAERAGLKVDVVASEHTTEGLIAALVTWASRPSGR